MAAEGWMLRMIIGHARRSTAIEETETWQWVKRTTKAVKTALEELAWLLYRARYAEEPEARLLPRARDALARLDRDLPGAQP